MQPHSGAQANMAVMMACLKPGETFMGLDLAHGGHLTHGSPVNMSGILYNAVAYGLSETTGMIDAMNTSYELSATSYELSVSTHHS